MQLAVCHWNENQAKPCKLVKVKRACKGEISRDNLRGASSTGLARPHTGSTRTSLHVFSESTLQKCGYKENALQLKGVVSCRSLWCGCGQGGKQHGNGRGP